MGDKRVKSDGGGEEPPLSMSEIFYKEFPKYLAMGMTYDLYWHGDACLPKYYLKASILKRKMENESAWLQGCYFYDAIICASPLLHDFVKNPKPIPYLDEPYPLTKKDIEERKRRKEKQAMDKEIEKMKMRAEAWNKLFEGEQNAR